MFSLEYETLKEITSGLTPLLKELRQVLKSLSQAEKGKADRLVRWLRLWGVSRAFLVGRLSEVWMADKSCPQSLQSQDQNKIGVYVWHLTPFKVAF